ncbi:F-box/LRR-repeat protein 17-like [Battus philenor]|uniref:F-box/LRR-repeat protein 17-like n=1 Tax=Battus philenor TaxID=42288 RepID=UPI0035CEE576
MSRYKQPKKLESLALAKLGDWIALQAESQMSATAVLAQENISNAQVVLGHKIEAIRSFLDINVPWMTYDTLAVETIRALSDLIEKTKNSYGFRVSMGKFVTQMNVIVKMSEVLFTKNLTYLSIDKIPKMIRSVFYSKLKMLKGLVYLNLGSLSGGWKTIDMEGAIIESLKELHNLKYLFINYDCTDNILICVVQNCPKIEKLDVSSSKFISDESIDIICNLKKLKSVQLYRTSVTWSGFANMLLHCENLEDVGRCDEIGRVLEFIHKSDIGLKQLKLKTYVSRYATDNHLKLAVKMCPLIHSMTVFHNTLQSDLMVLIGLEYLKELKLLSCDFYADHIKQILQVKGCNIINLHLEHVDQIDLNALMYISQMCPLLESLTLYNCTLIQHTSLYTKKLEILPFRNLKKLTCVSTCTDEQLLFLLTNCVNIQFIQIGTAIQFDDDFILKILEKNPLIHLRELRIMQSDFMTITSVERIIQSCMSLEILVELESWTLLTEDDREFIRNYIKVNNFNIDTSPIRRYDE